MWWAITIIVGLFIICNVPDSNPDRTEKKIDQLIEKTNKLEEKIDKFEEQLNELNIKNKKRKNE